MAKEKVRKKIKFERPEIKLNIKKTRRDKQATACSVSRRNGCGICGSKNITKQGVEYCTKCSKEELVLINNSEWLFNLKSNFCKCLLSWKVKSYTYHFKPYKIISVLKCMDCGAVMSNFCPNCKPDKNCWYKAGKFYCRKCGFVK